MKKVPGNMIILDMCTIKEDHMMYYSWDIRRNRYFLSFWTIFCPFTVTLTIWEKQSFERLEKTPGGISILHMCTINGNHMMYVSWRYGVWQTEFFVILDGFLPFYPPNNKDYQNFEKTRRKKNTRRYYHFKHVYHKWQPYYVWFPR